MLVTKKKNHIDFTTKSGLLETLLIRPKYRYELKTPYLIETTSLPNFDVSTL